MSSLSLQYLAELVGGKVLGDGTVLIRDALPQQDAVVGCITLADSARQAINANRTDASAVVVSQAYPDCSKPQLVVSNIHQAFTQLVVLFRPQNHAPANYQADLIDSTAVVDPTATLAAGVRIGPRVMVGRGCKIGAGSIIHHGVTLMENCCIGENCEVFPGSVFYAGTRVGNRVLVHANVVLGAYGFGYRQQDGKHVRTAQLGWVEVHDDVEIGAGTTIDRGTYGATRIGKGTKIDNQVQIGHNCHIGAHNLICSQVGIAGSCTTGSYVVMGGQVGMADHVHISDHAMLGAQSGLMANVGEGEVVLGSPAGPRKQKFLEWACLAKLPELRKEFRELMTRVAMLEAAKSSAVCDARETRDAA